MQIIQIAVVGIIASVLAVMLKKEAPQISLIISIAVGVIIFLEIIPELFTAVNLIKSVTEKTDISVKYILLIIKIIGVAYIAQFSTQICIDAGESAIASKIELAGKIFIMVISAPVIMDMIELVETVL